MNGLNKVFILGYLGSDPEQNLSKNGKNYSRLSIATHRPKKQENGGFDTTTEWHNVTVWGKRSKVCQEYLKKGAKIMVEGFLSHYEFLDDNGSMQKRTSITANNIEFF